MAQDPAATGLSLRFDSDVNDISAHTIQNKVAAVRDLNLDIAIDLSGWTSGHFLGGFLAKLAPVQCSYLGFFASTGIEEIDYWLGDWSLFPLITPAGIQKHFGGLIGRFWHGNLLILFRKLLLM